MTHINLDISRASPKSQLLLQEIQSAFGATPNLFKAASNSPAALKILWQSFAELIPGSLDPKLIDQIAVAVANKNRCVYCVSAHTAAGLNVGLTASQLAASQLGQSDDLKTKVALTFTLKIVELRGAVSPRDIQDIRDAGFTDGDIMEIMIHIAMNQFTNYVAVAFDVPVDFPKIPLQSINSSKV